MHDVFISYSRKDKPFVQAMHATLAQQNYDVWVDWEDIPLSADFMAEIYAGIEAADTFIFVISPDSVASEICGLEVQHAIQHHKRLLPVLRREVHTTSVPQPLAAHNWVYCREQDDFAAAMAGLVQAINTDPAYVKVHTRLLTRALEWEKKAHESSLLLRGRDLQEAEGWLGASDKEPQPTAIQRQYVLQSRRAATRRQRQLLGSVVGALVLTAVLALVAVWQWRAAVVAEAEATHQADLATTAQQLAELQRASSITRQLAAQAEATRNQRGSLLPQSLLLAAASLRREPSLTAEGALHRGLSLLPRPVGNLLHETSIRAVLVSSDGGFVVTTSDEGATLWSLPEGERVRTIKHDTSIFAADMSPDGTRLASASGKRVAFWSLPDGSAIDRIDYEAEVWDVAWSPDGHYLAVALAQSSTRIWDVAAKREEAQLGAHQSTDFVLRLAWSPDSTRLATGRSSGVATIWLVPTGREHVTVQHDGAFGGINALVWNPDGTYLATAGDDYTGRVWDAGTGLQYLHDVHNAQVTSVSFSPDGTYVAVGGEDGSAAIWHMRDRTVLQRVRHQGGLEALRFTRDNRALLTASRDATARMWALDDGSEIGRMPHSASVGAVVTTRDGRFIVTASEDGTARVWEGRGGFEAGRVILPTGVDTSAFSPDGRYVAAATRDGKLHCYEITTGLEVLSLPLQHRSALLSFSHDGHFLAAASSDPSVTTIWELASGKEVVQLPDALTLRKGILWSPDNRHVALYGLNGANVWEIASRRKLLDVAAPSGVLFGELVWSPSGAEVFTTRTGVIDDTFGTWGQRWDLQSGREVAKLDFSNGVAKLSWSPDGAMIAAVGGDRGTVVQLISTSTSKEHARLEHDGTIVELAWSTDSALLATAAADDQARVWNVADGSLVARLRHQDDVIALRWSADGTRVATGSADLTARVWEAKTGREVAYIPHDDTVTAVAFTKDGTRLATASRDQGAYEWLLQADELVEEVCTRVGRNLSPDEWRQYVGEEPYVKTCPALP